MRIQTVLLCVLATTAQAKDCESPRLQGHVVVGLTAFADCMNDRVTRLETENAALREEMKTLRASLADIPGAFKNDNGKVTQRGGDTVMKANFSTAARKGQAASGLAIDQGVMESLCGVGCTIHLALTAETLRKDDPPPVFADATCSLRYSVESGAWSQGGGCGDAVSGTDGDGKPPGQSGGDIIAVAGEACLLADAEPARSLAVKGQTLAADRTKGLFLIADPLLFPGTDARFRCELQIGQ